MDSRRRDSDGSDSDQEKDYDIHEARCNAHRRKIGLKCDKSKNSNITQETVAEKEDRFVQYVRETFKMKECAKFVPKGGQSKKHLLIGPQCNCGEQQAQHWHELASAASDEGSLLQTSPRSRSNQSSRNSSIMVPMPPRRGSMALTPDIVKQELHRIEEEKHKKSQTMPQFLKANAVFPFKSDAEASGEDPEEQNSPVFRPRRLNAIVNPLFKIEENAKEVEDVGTSRPLNESEKAEAEMEWNEEDAFIEMPTNAFGKVEFANDESRSKPAKYVRISNNTSTSLVLDLMLNHWKMAQPNRPSLVISVNGGAKNFKLDGKKREIFNQGLVKAAYATNAWIITTGCNMGVMKTVGEAVREGQTLQLARNRVTHNLRCIGITSWGYVQNRQDLISTDGKGCWPATYHVDPVIRHGQPVSLDSNHTHFLIVDDGYRNYFRTKFADFRAKLERLISLGNENEAGIPVVMVLVEGGLDVLDFAYESLKHRIPLVLCEGTGRAADILAFAFRNHVKDGSDTKESRILLPYHRALVLDKLQAAYGKTLKSSKNRQMIIFEEKIQQISACCQDEDLVTVFDINKNEDFDLAILSALLKGRGAKPLDQLKLALKWNRSDMAAEELFNDKTAWNWSDLDDLMTEALMYNKKDFVRLLLQHGVVIKDYLTVTRLRTLYNAAGKGSHFRKMLHDIAGVRGKAFLCDVKRVLERLLRHVDQAYGLDEVEAIHCREMHKVQQSHACKTCGEGDVVSPMIGEAHFIKPFKELFIWAILLNRPTMARFFWERGENPVMGGLVAAKLYGSLLDEIGERNSDIAKQYIVYKMEFEALAINVVQQTHSIDAEKSLVIIERPHSLWGNLTCQQMASLGFAKRFMATTCCQTSIDQTWKRGLRCSFWEVIIGFLCPIYVLFFVKFDNLLLGYSDLSVGQKMRIFYMSPVTKFCSNLIFYVLFLILYTYVILFDVTDAHFSIPEVAVHCWVISIALSESYQVIQTAAIYSGKARGANNQILFKWRSLSLLKQLAHLTFWTKLTLTGVTLHFIGFGQRFMTDSEEMRDWTRLNFCMAIAIFYFKIFRYYMASSYLGPKLFVIKKMFHDVFMFLTILIVIMLAYAVAAQALLYPERGFYWGIFTDLLYHPYWQLYGELSIDDTIGGNKEGCTNSSITNEKGQYCPRKFWPVAIILAVYLLIGNILLINLLIAIFTHVFDEVEKNSTEIWKYEMWSLASDFDNMPVLPPPFNLPETLLCFISWIAQCNTPGKNSEILLNERQHENLQIFEKECMNEYLRSVEERKTAEIGFRAEMMQKQLDNLCKRFDDELKNNSSHLESLQQSSIYRSGSVFTPPPQTPVAKAAFLPRPPSALQSTEEMINKQKKFEEDVAKFEERSLQLKNLENLNHNPSTSTDSGL